MADRPLIEEAEGKDQDERSVVVAAVLAVLRRSDRRQVTDLHLLELCKWIHRLDRGKTGALLSHQEIAKALLLEISTARAVVKRAVEMELLLKIEQRYVSGGQNSNRYEINWPLIRALARGDGPGVTMYHPPATRRQEAATRYQGAVTRCHPYKEYTGLSLTDLTPETSPPPTESKSALAVTNQEEEVIQKNAAGLARVQTADQPPRRTAPLGALITALEQAGVYDAHDLVEQLAPRVGEQYLTDVLRHWTSHAQNWDGPGALRTRLKRSRPEMAIDKGWPPGKLQVAPPRPTKTADQVRAQRDAYLLAKAEAAKTAAEDVPLAEQLREARNKTQSHFNIPRIDR